jgi:hypothetical protein
VEYLPQGPLADKVGPWYICDIQRNRSFGMVGGTSILPKSGFFVLLKYKKGAIPQVYLDLWDSPSV